ncbi:MAG: CAAD domain-containing protein [Synechococcaceae cyanobacterium]|nr:CAAD domain-containing protein [Synechococcaceae cyanobacterium]
MAETPPTPGTPDPEGSEVGTDTEAAAPTGVDALLEQIDAAADVDDLPSPHHETVPPTPEALARPASEPGIAATLEVPPLPAGESPEGEAAGGGGEWELLVGKVRAWLGSGELQKFLSSIRGPLKGLAYLIALLLLLRVYGSVVGTIDGLPLIGGLLELVGLIAFTRFALSNLVRRSTREQTLADWQRRWNDFRGRV